MIFRWLTAVLVIAVGILLIVSCLDIYNSGANPYTPEAIALRFSRICIPIYITVACVIAGIGLSLLFPDNTKQRRAPQREQVILQRLRDKTGELDATAQILCDAEVRRRRIALICAIAAFTALMIYPLIYFLNFNHFTEESLNSDIIKATIIVLGHASVGLVICWIYQLTAKASMQREINVYKKSLASGNKKSSASVIPQKKDYTGLIRWSLLGIACLLIVLGMINGGATDVFKKAVAICTECIGLG